jgi:hypothetical protein
MLSELRRFGTEISGNRQKLQESKPETRAAIVTAIKSWSKPSTRGS